MNINLLKASSNLVRTALVFGLLTMVCVGGVRANFVDNFAPSQWTLQPDQGQAYFANSDSELDIVGPTGNFYPSIDVVSLLVPATTGGAWGWQLSFNWAFSAGGSEGVQASIYFPGIAGDNPLVFASGGAGASATGSYSFIVNPGETVTFSLSSDDTGTGKQPSSFGISNFGFVYTAPDVTPWIDFALVLPLFGRRVLSAVVRK